MASADPLAKRLVDRSFELLKAQPWRLFEDEMGFLLTTDDHPDPVLVGVLGPDGGDPGFDVLTGGDPFSRLRPMQGAAPSSPEEDPIDWLDLTFVPFGEVPSEFRRLHRLAKLSLRREATAPLVRAHRPHRPCKNPNRTEMRLLLAATEVLLKATTEEWDDLTTPLDPEILKVHMSGRPPRHEITTERIPHPRPDLLEELSAAYHEANAAPASPDEAAASREPGDETTERRGQWFLAVREVPASVANDGTSTVNLLLLFDQTTGELLDTMPGFDSPMLEIAVSHLLRRALHVQGWSHDLIPARELLYDQPDLRLGLDVFDRGGEPYIRFGPPSREVEAALTSIMKEFQEERPRLSITQGLESFEARLHHEACVLIDSLINVDLEEELEKLGRNREGVERRYFGTTELPLEVEEEPGINNGQMEWEIYVDRPTRKSRTVAETFLARGQCNERMADLIRARAAGTTSLYRVIDIPNAGTLSVEDTLSGERLTLHDVELAGLALPDDVLPLKLYRLDDFTGVIMVGPILDELLGDEVVDDLESLGIDLTAPLPPEQAHHLGRAFLRVGLPDDLADPPETAEFLRGIEDDVPEPLRAETERRRNHLRLLKDPDED